MARVGVDLVSVREVADSVERYGQRYLDRVFTDHEQECCTGEPLVRARSLAARFAAKEAAVKALRLVDGPGDWRSIEVRRSPAGWCDLVLSGKVEQLAVAAGITDLAIALSHENDMAVAVVTCSARDQKEFE